MKYFTVHYGDAMAGFDTLTHALNAVRLALRIQGLDAAQARSITDRMRTELGKRGRPHAVNHGAITLRTWASAADAYEVLRYEADRQTQSED